MSRDRAETIAYAIRKECQKDSLYDWCETWDITIDEFEEFLANGLMGVMKMNKAFEKIIKKLEERQKEYLVGFGIHDNNEMYGVACGLGDAIEIVKQEAEQFGTDINVGSN